MSLPIRPNTTCDIFRISHAPPGDDPDVAAVPCFLLPDWRRGQEAGDRSNPGLTWTHVLLVAADVDIRDQYIGISGQSGQDRIWIPDGNGTSFNVVFVELVQRGTPNEHKRVYIDRFAPTWPTNEL